MTDTKLLRVLFFLRRIGPYHHARFEALSKHLQLTAVATRPGSQEYPWQFEPDGNYDVHSFPIPENAETGIRGHLLYKEIETLLDTHKPTCIVTTGWADAEYHAVVLAGIKRKIPMVVISDSRYEDEQRYTTKEFIKRQIVRSYSAALVAGTSSRNYLIKLGFPSQAIFHPWDVVDNNHFSNFATEPHLFEELSFICIARFIEKKNIKGLLEAYAGYKLKGGIRKLLLLGAGPLEGEILDRIEHFKIMEDVLLPGFAQYEKLPYYFSRSFCLILPSFSDQWGLVVNEAMAAGLPVLVSKGCGCAEDLVDVGMNGYTFEPGDLNELSLLMLRMDHLPKEVWVKMSELARIKIEYWDTNRFAKALLDTCEYASSNTRIGKRWIHYLLSKL